MVLEKPDDEKTANIVFALISLQAFSLKCLIIGHGLKFIKIFYILIQGSVRLNEVGLGTRFPRHLSRSLTNHAWVTGRLLGSINRHRMQGKLPLSFLFM